MQQVNLFQAIEKKKRVFISSLHVLSVLFAVFCVMGLLQAFKMQNIQPLKTNVAAHEQEQERIQQQLVQLEQQLLESKPDSVLVQEVRQLRSKVLQGHKLLNLLTQGALSNTQGFSPYLLAVANKHVQGTWLTHIDIESGGTFFSLTGKTITPNLVPEYIKSLSSELIFNDFIFNVLELQRSEEEPDVVNFHLATNDISS